MRVHIRNISSVYIADFLLQHFHVPDLTPFPLTDPEYEVDEESDNRHVRYNKSDYCLKMGDVFLMWNRFYGH